MCTNLELSRVPDGNLPSAEVASRSTVLRGLPIGVRWTFSKMTVRRSEHVRHEEDLKGHLAPFLPDCSLVPAKYLFLMFNNDLLLYQDETARAVSRYYFRLSNQNCAAANICFQLPDLKAQRITQSLLISTMSLCLKKRLRYALLQKTLTALLKTQSGS
jgi:hypothetical protein